MPTPLTPLPDYMSEEKLQEKGMVTGRGFVPTAPMPAVGWGEYQGLSEEAFMPGGGVFPSFFSPQMAAAAGKALCREEEIWLCGCPEGGHAA